MAKIKNLENNLEFAIFFKRNEMFDYLPNRSDFENWIPFVLSLALPNKISEIDESSKATMTIYELKDLIEGLENTLRNLYVQRNYIFEFSNSEGFFELRFEVISEDSMIEMELWINKGNQTKGKICGFDEGIRTILDKDAMGNFLKELKEDFSKIISTPNTQEHM